MIYFPTYRNRMYGVTGVIAISGRDNLSVKQDNEERSEMNELFLKKIIKKEKDINKFMKKFYDRTLVLPHTSAYKVCKIREIDPANIENEESEWISKKEEC